MPCLLRIGRSAALPTHLGCPRASGQPLRPVGCLLPKAGRTCLIGKPCKSHCVADSGSHSRSRLAVAGAPRNLGAATALMHLVSMHTRAPGLAKRAKLLSEHGARLPAKQLALKGGQQWLVNTTAPGVAPDDRKRPLGGALCCDATLVSPLTRAGGPHSGAATHRMAQSCAPPCAAQTRHLP